MAVLSLITLAISLVSIYCTVNIAEEVVQVATGLLAFICLFLSFVFAPGLIQLIIVIALLISFHHYHSAVPPYHL